MHLLVEGGIVRVETPKMTMSSWGPLASALFHESLALAVRS